MKCETFIPSFFILLLYIGFDPSMAERYIIS